MGNKQMMKKDQSGLVVTVSKHSISVQGSMLGAFTSCDAGNRCLHDTRVCVLPTHLQKLDRSTSLIAIKATVRLFGGAVGQVL